MIKKLRNSKGVGVLEVILLIATIAILSLIILTGCTLTAQVVRKEPIRGRYKPAHYETNTTLQHKYDAWSDEYVYVPITKAEYVDETWEILYDIEYDNGKHSQAWLEVSEEEYNEIKK